MTRRLVDVVLALLGLVLLAPVWIVSALLVRVTSRGPAFHRAERVGRGGRRFAMLKLRTMRAAAGGPAVAGDGDPRVTRVGRILRSTHLDEWPQLWNVVRGDMSFVGPRPEDPRFVDLDDARWQRVLSIRPGLTGPTQLVWARREGALLQTADPEATYRRDVLPQKLEADVAYLEHRSLMGDLACLVRTLFAPLARVGA